MEYKILNLLIYRAVPPLARVVRVNVTLHAVRISPFAAMQSVLEQKSKEMEELRRQVARLPSNPAWHLLLTRMNTMIKDLEVVCEQVGHTSLGHFRALFQQSAWWALPLLEDIYDELKSRLHFASELPQDVVLLIYGGVDGAWKRAGCVNRSWRSHVQKAHDLDMYVPKVLALSTSSNFPDGDVDWSWSVVHGHIRAWRGRGAEAPPGNLDTVI